LWWVGFSSVGIIAGAPGLSGADEEEEVNFARDFVAQGILHWVDTLHAGQRPIDKTAPGDESNHTASLSPHTMLNRCPVPSSLGIFQNNRVRWGLCTGFVPSHIGKKEGVNLTSMGDAAFTIYYRRREINTHNTVTRCVLLRWASRTELSRQPCGIIPFLLKPKITIP
jgi:hypothetical protein